MTTILFAACAAASAGFAASVNALNKGKYVKAAIKHPAIMIDLRPILSDKAPNTTKNGVPITSDAAIIKFAVALSTFKVFVKKNKA